MEHFAFQARNRQILYKVLSCVAFVAIGGAILFYGYKIENLGNETYRNTLEMNATVDLIELREDIEEVILDNTIALSELAALLGESPDMTQDTFARYVRIAMDNSPYVIGVAAARNQVLEMIQPIEDESSRIDNRENELLLPQERDALKSGKGNMTGPTALRSGERALVLRKPVLLAPTAGTAERESWGIVSMGIDFDQLLDGLHLPELQERYDLLIRQVGTADRTVPPMFGVTETLALDPVRLEFDFPFGQWEIAAVPLGGWPKQRPHHLERWLIRFTAVALILLGLHFVMLLVRKQRVAERRLTNGIEALEHGFVMFGPDGDIVLTNSKYKQMHGLIECPSKTDGKIPLAAMETAMSMPPAELDWRNLKLSGKHESEEEIPDGRIIKTSDTLMRDGSIVGLRIDVTDLKKAQLNAEAANKAKTDFMGVLSHELRTPMTVILGQVRLAQNIEKLPAPRALNAAVDAQPDGGVALKPRVRDVLCQVSQMMDKAERSGNHLMMLINEVLDFAKIDSGNLSVDAQRTWVSDIIALTDEQMRPLVEGKGLHFDVQVEDAETMADNKRIQQVVINLISNAVKFTEQGTIGLHVTALPESIAITVTDSGIGIPPEETALVFEPFHQVDSTATRRHGGTGLGLAISRDIATAHGGALSVTSEIGKGSAFTLTLPRLTEPSVIVLEQPPEPSHAGIAAE